MKKTNSALFQKTLEILWMLILSITPLICSNLLVKDQIQIKWSFLSLLIPICIILLILKQNRILFKNIFLLPIVFLIIFKIISLKEALNFYEACKNLYQIIILATFYLISINLLNQPRLLIKSLTISIITSGFVAINGLSQFFYPNIFHPSKDAFGEVAYGSTLGHPNFAADYLIVVMPVLLGFAFSKKFSKLKFLGFGFFFIDLFYLAITLCRGAWLGLFIGSTFLINQIFNKDFSVPRGSLSKKIFLGILTIIIIWGFWFWEPTRSKLISSLNLKEGPIAFRIDTWSSTLKMIQDRPLAGFGVGNFSLFFPLYRKEWIQSGETRVVQTHNDYLQLASESGIGALLSFLWLIISLIFLSYKQKDILIWKIDKTLGWGVIAGSLALLTEAFFSFPLQNPASSLYFWFMLGILSTKIYNQKLLKKDPEKNTSLHLFLKRLVLIILIFILFTGSWVFGFCAMLSNYYLKKSKISSFYGAESSALISLGQALAINSFEYDAYLQRAKIFSESGKLSEASQDQEKYLKLQPFSPYALNNLAQIYYRGGDSFKALEISERALKIQPDSTRALNMLGQVAQDLGYYSKAVSYHQKALAIGTQNAHSRYLLGLALLRSGDTAQASEEIWQAIQEGAEGAQIYNDLGVALASLGRYQDAEKAFRKALEYDPEHSAAKQNLEKFKLQKKEPAGED